MNEVARARLLAEAPLFSTLPEPVLRELALLSTTRRYGRGQILFMADDPAESLLVVAEGSLKAYATSPRGDDYLLAVLDQGDTIGELTVADGQARSANVAALTDAVVLQLPRRELMAVAARSPELTASLLATMAQVIRRLTDTAADLVFLDVPRRVAKLILAQQQPRGGTGGRRGQTQSDMATQAGTSRQSINAALRDFERRGWISLAGQRVELLDVEALRGFVQS